jgi:hypothetical protein
MQMQGIGFPAKDTVKHLSSRSLDNVVGMVTTAANATVSNVIGMFGTDVGLGQLVQPVNTRAESRCPDSRRIYIPPQGPVPGLTF